jgi:HlyD family secretion protein
MGGDNGAKKIGRRRSERSQSNREAEGDPRPPAPGRRDQGYSAPAGDEGRYRQSSCAADHAQVRCDEPHAGRCCLRANLSDVRPISGRPTANCYSEAVRSPAVNAASRRGPPRASRPGRVSRWTGKRCIAAYRRRYTCPHIQVSAYSSRVVPKIPGTVRTVSADRLIDDTTQQPYYLARVAVDRQTLERLASTVDLIPGMTVEVLIVTERRTMFDYIPKPFRDAFWRSFREI